MKKEEIMLGTKAVVVLAHWKAALGELEEVPTEWPQEIHALVCARVAADVFGVAYDSVECVRLYELYNTKGLAGNPSQTRQWLVDEKLIPAKAKKSSALAATLLKGTTPPTAAPTPPATP